MMAVFMGAAGPVLLIVVVVWAVINAVRYLIGMEWKKRPRAAATATNFD